MASLLFTGNFLKEHNSCPSELGDEENPYCWDANELSRVLKC